MEYQEQYNLLFPITGSLKYAKALHKYLQVITMFSDSRAELIDFKKYRDLVNAGWIKDSKYWRIENGQYGVIIKNYYMSYSNTIDLIKTAKTDFTAGWYAAQGR